MTNETTPYISRNEGDLIAAEDWNAVQVKIKEDITSQVGQVETALEEHVQAPVDADTFDGKTPEVWKGDLDKRYALKDHAHDGVRRYRRYFLELETVIAGPPPRLQPAVIIHNMGRNPVMQVYELEDLPIVPPGGASLPRDYKFSFCGPEHANDPEALEFKTRSWDERHWGEQLDLMIEDLARDLDEEQQQAFRAQFQDNFTLNVWLSNLEKVLFEPGPGQYHFDTGDVYRTQWVKDRANKIVNELKNQGEWPPRFVYRPRLANFLVVEERLIFVEIFHLNLNEVEIWPNTDQETHLMVLLRA